MHTVKRARGPGGGKKFPKLFSLLFDCLTEERHEEGKLWLPLLHHHPLFRPFHYGSFKMIGMLWVGQSSSPPTNVCFLTVRATVYPTLDIPRGSAEYCGYRSGGYCSSFLNPLSYGAVHSFSTRLKERQWMRVPVHHYTV